MYYKRYCSILRKIVREAKKMYYNELIVNSDNKTKMTWKIIKKTNRKNSKLSTYA